MVQMKIVTAIALGLFGLNAFAQGCEGSSAAAGAAAQMSGPGIEYQTEIVRNITPSVPEYVVFAEDTIRFDTPEKYERMDRELITFSYMHSTSTLMLKRSEKIFTVVEPILKEMGIPDDLKYLMVIESNLDPKALSTAKAAGLWQFMKATAVQYGLECNEYVDERYHIEKATRAACKLLKATYSKYHDWMTVAATYNAGPGNISKRMADQRQKSAFKLWMPEETMRYMYRIMACKMLFADPESFGFKVTEHYPYRAPKKIVEVSDAEVNLVDLAEKNGVTYSELKQANYWLRDSKIINKSGKTYQVAIPDCSKLER